MEVPCATRHLFYVEPVLSSKQKEFFFFCRHSPSTGMRHFRDTPTRQPDKSTASQKVLLGIPSGMLNQRPQCSSDNVLGLSG